MEDFIKNLENKKVKIVFGLEAQGHIPTIEKIIKKHNDNYNEQYPNEPLDLTYKKYVWEEIGEEIGWCPFTAALNYFKYLNKK